TVVVSRIEVKHLHGGSLPTTYRSVTRGERVSQHERVPHVTSARRRGQMPTSSSRTSSPNFDRIKRAPGPAAGSRRSDRPARGAWSMKVGLFYRPQPTPSTIFGAGIAADDFVHSLLRHGTCAPQLFCAPHDLEEAEARLGVRPRDERRLL